MQKLVSGKVYSENCHNNQFHIQDMRFLCIEISYHELGMKNCRSKSEGKK